MDTYEVGDELSHLRMFEVLSLVGLNEKSLSAEKHKVKMKAHPKGVMVELQSGETWLVMDAAIQAVKKASKKPEAKPEAKK